MDWMSRFNRSRSSLLFIFCETETLSAKGMRTMYLPASDNSDVILGPFVEIGSLATWMRTG